MGQRAATKCTATETADHRHRRRLLRARRDGPRCRRAAQCEYEFSPSDVHCHATPPARGCAHAIEGRYHALAKERTMLLCCEILSRPLRSWVRTDKTPCEHNESGYPSIADMRADIDWRRLVPCVDGSELKGLSSRLQHWSVQPCVRPLDAAHMALAIMPSRIRSRSKARIRDAMALVGCPDRRIDRLCITCCSSSQPSHHASCRRDLVMPPARRDSCNARPWPSSPRPFGRAYWRARWQRPWSAAAPTTP